MSQQTVAEVKMRAYDLIEKCTAEKEAALNQIELYKQFIQMVSEKIGIQNGTTGDILNRIDELVIAEDKGKKKK